MPNLTPHHESIGDEPYEKPNASLALLVRLNNEVISQGLKEGDLLNEAGHISSAGREISEDLYDSVFEESGRDYQQLLKTCRAAEELLNRRVREEGHDPTPFLRIIQSLRGKAVYRSTAAWVAERAVPVNKGGLSASNLAKLSKVIRDQNNVEQAQVYEQAKNLEWTRIDATFLREQKRLEEESAAIIAQDLSALEPGLRERITTRMAELSERFLPRPVKQAMAAAAIAGIVFLGGYTVLNSPSGAEAAEAVWSTPTPNSEKYGLETYEKPTETSTPSPVTTESTVDAGVAEEIPETPAPEPTATTQNASKESEFGQEVSEKPKSQEVVEEVETIASAPEVAESIRSIEPTPSPEPSPTPGDEDSPWTIYNRPAKNPYSEIIKEVFGDRADDMEKVLRWGTPGPGTKYGREYGGENLSYNPGAINYNKNGTEDRGLFMINSNTFKGYMVKMPERLAELGITSFDDMFDPLKNIEMAKLIFDSRGTDPWYGRSPDLKEKGQPAEVDQTLILHQNSAYERFFNPEKIVKPFSEEHSGIDIPGWEGEPLPAIIKGKVYFSGWEDDGYGNLIIIESLDAQLRAYYAHLMDGVALRPGEEVNSGDILGELGSTGNSLGPHLHLELRIREEIDGVTRYVQRDPLDPAVIKLLGEYQ